MLCRNFCCINFRIKRQAPNEVIRRLKGTLKKAMIFKVLMIYKKLLVRGIKRSVSARRCEGGGFGAISKLRQS